MPASPQLLRQLQLKKQQAEKRGREFSLRKPRIREPKQIERQYRNLMVERMKDLVTAVENLLIPKLNSFLSNNAQSLPSDLQRTDALADDLFVVMNQIKVQFAQVWPEQRTRQTSRKSAEETSQHNASQINKVMKTTLDLDLFQSEPWLQGQIENFIEQNVALIKSVDDRYFTEIQQTVFRGARQGQSVKEIAESIRKRGKVSQSKAELIARDQINKFNGQLSEIRQREVGVNKYVWRTSQDERVRPEHAAREGKVYSWSNPPADGHPGEPINCRCYAEPVLEDLV